MAISRRKFLFWGLALAAGTTYLGSHLLRAKPRFKGLRSDFPEKFKKLGFEVYGHVNLEGDREVLIIAERHNEADIRAQESSFIDFLIEQYGADSLGLEGLYGKPHDSIDEKVERDFRVYLQANGLDPLCVTRESYSSGDFAKYVRQESVPCFGFEDEELYFRSLMLVASWRTIAKVTLEKRLNHRAYDDIPDIGRIERFFNYVRGRFPEEEFPDGTLDDLTRSPSPEGKVREFLEYVNRIHIEQRNKVMGPNILRQMSDLGFRRSVIVIGQGHIDKDRENTNLYNYMPLPMVIVLAPQKQADWY